MEINISNLPTIKDYYKQYDLNVSCFECNRNHVADYDMLISRFNGDLPIEKLEKIYVCKECNSNDAVRIRIALKEVPTGVYPDHF